MKVSILPLDIVFADPEANLKRVVKSLEKVPEGTDIVVLPELFTSSFVHDPETLKNVLSFQGKTLETLMDQARSHDLALAGSFAASDGGHVYNRAFFVQPDGSVAFYDKHHLFAPSGEDVTFTAGKRQPPVISFRGWNITIFVCFDLRFPAWCRNEGLKYDLLLLPANWGATRSYALSSLLAGRAIENQAYTAGANRTGSDEYGSYTREMSMIYDHKGRPIGQDEGEFVTATLDYEKMDIFRHKFPAWENADKFTFI